MVSGRIASLWAVGRAIVIGGAIVLVGATVLGPVVAHDNGTTSHLWDHIKAMREVGTINESTNPVDWTKLKGVPSTIADGIDNIGAAGFGIKQVFGAFFVDTEKIQRRVATACATGQAIQQINQNGTIVCTTGPKALTLRIADTGQICNVSCTEGSLALTPGTWAITAKITVTQNVGGERLYVFCELHAGGLEDSAGTQVFGDAYYTNDTLPMQLLATYTDNANASVNCGDGDVGSAFGSSLSIIAIRVSN